MSRANNFIVGMCVLQILAMCRWLWCSRVSAVDHTCCLYEWFWCWHLTQSLLMIELSFCITVNNAASVSQVKIFWLTCICFLLSLICCRHTAGPPASPECGLILSVPCHDVTLLLFRDVRNRCFILVRFLKKWNSHLVQNDFGSVPFPKNLVCFEYYSHLILL